MGIGDWGLGPIPNPQSPMNINRKKKILYIIIHLINLIIILFLINGKLNQW